MVPPLRTVQRSQAHPEQLLCEKGCACTMRGLEDEGKILAANSKCTTGTYHMALNVSEEG